MTEKQETRRVSDVAKDRELSGEQIKIADLVNHEFTITAIAEYHSTDGPYLAVSITGQRGDFFFFTSNRVVMDKLRQCIGYEPLLATIKKIEPGDGKNWYYDVE